MQKLILAVILISLFGCTKSGVGPGTLTAGTQCSLVQGIFEAGQFQPTPPLTIQGVYQQDGELTIYNAVDTKGIVWQIPDNDLQIIK